ncbi:MAG: DUF2085 domain-containing protein [Promethearchaeota archaeon]
MVIKSPHNDEQYGILRRIFLNLLIIAFITITYIYLSEPFGSISTNFINNPQFSIQFGITLLLFSFLSVLAGPINGLISGFLGELLYQLAFYGTIYIEWCFIIAIYGLLVGIYKYHPLKYHKRLNIFYAFLALSISTIITFWLIIVFRIIFYPSQPIGFILINYGVEFLFNTLVSVLIIIPLLLFLYDKLFAKKERQLYYMFLTHHPLSASDHTFYLKFGRTKIYFCTRCSGVILGGLLALFTTYIVYKINQVEFSAEIALLLCIILPIPGLIDWGTQRLQLRRSSTESRLFTGFIIGLALHFMSYTQKYYFYTILLLTLYFSIFFLLVYFGHKKEMKLLKEEMDKISVEKEP